MPPGASADRPEPPFSPIEDVLQDLRDGRMIILLDDEDRENEGDLVCAAEKITPEMVNFMLRHGRGTLCVSLSRSRCQQLQLTPQAPQNTTVFGTAFTVAIDAAPQHGVRTGVSARDRCTTIRLTVDEAARPEDFVRPGHVNPLTAMDGGTLVRAGQTEGSVDLCRLAGLMPAGALIEILNDDGTMARLPELTAFAKQYDLKLCTVAAIIEYRMQREHLVERVEEVAIRNRHGDWRLFAYQTGVEQGLHLALTFGGIGAKDDQGVVAPVSEPTLIRVHSECLTGDVFGSMRCECGEQLDAAMATIAAAGRGALIYLRQEGRGIGLLNKLKAYRLQDDGLDTVDANLRLGLPADRRDYGVGAQILRDLGLQRVRILTNNPKKVSRLEVYGLEVVEQLPLEIPPNDTNRRYLEAKKLRMGHDLRQV